MCVKECSESGLIKKFICFDDEVIKKGVAIISSRGFGGSTNLHSVLLW